MEKPDQSSFVDVRESAFYSLTTAEIFYHMPDHPDLLHTYVWQSLDRVPDFPKLNHFLDFSMRDLEGKLHSVRVAYVGAMGPAEWRAADCSLTLH